jgi:hypothetical protein
MELTSVAYYTVIFKLLLRYQPRTRGSFVTGFEVFTVAAFQIPEFCRHAYNIF